MGIFVLWLYHSVVSGIRHSATVACRVVRSDWVQFYLVTVELFFLLLARGLNSQMLN